MMFEAPDGGTVPGPWRQARISDLAHRSPQWRPEPRSAGEAMVGSGAASAPAPPLVRAGPTEGPCKHAPSSPLLGARPTARPDRGAPGRTQVTAGHGSGQTIGPRAIGPDPGRVSPGPVVGLIRPGRTGQEAGSGSARARPCTHERRGGVMVTGVADHWR
jgi:hypothetical protein